MEKWKEVIGFEGLYEVSNYGNVRGKKGVLSKANQINGYQYVTLYKNNKGHHSLVHRLVAAAFIPNPEMLPEVNHISEDKKDNSVGNLEWCSHKYNHNYGTGHSRTAKKQGRQVKQLTTGGDLICIYDSIREASRAIGRHHKDISNVCNGRRKSSGGYRWEYV